MPSPSSVTPATQAMKIIKLLGALTGLLATTLLATQAISQSPSQQLYGGQYSNGLWPAGHGDAANTDYTPVRLGRDMQLNKHLLQGHPILWPAVTAGNGQVYVTSGKGPGHSHLHVFNHDGELLWKAAPQETRDDLDSLAVINAPAVDQRNHAYIADANQIWAFYPDGLVKWVSNIEEHGAKMGLVTPILLEDNLVGGFSTNGKLILLDRDSGQLARPVLDIAGVAPEAEDEAAEGLWQDLMDPAIVHHLHLLMQGWEMTVANTPAIHPTSGRIYITAAGKTADSGLLYGIDVDKDSARIAFATEMGAGSGTSPAVAHDGSAVYVVNGAGKLTAIDAYTGAVRWEAEDRGGGSASPSVGPDGSIYSPFQDQLLALTANGQRKFWHSYNHFCAEQIDTPGGFWSLLFSTPKAFIASLVTVDAANTGWINVVCGYHIKPLSGGSERTKVPLPQKSFVLGIDLDNGKPITKPLLIPETSEGFITPVANGNQFVTASSAIGSIFYHRLNRWLPERFAIKAEPQAGLMLLTPKNRKLQTVENLIWLEDQLQAASDALRGANSQSALRSLRGARTQWLATIASYQQAAIEQHLSTPVDDLQFGASAAELAIVEVESGEVDSARKRLRAALQSVKGMRSRLQARWPGAS